MRLYTKALAKEPGVHVPSRRARAVDRPPADHDLARRRAAACRSPTADAETRNAIAYNLFRAWYVPFYDYGVIHGDPHLGNYTVRDDHTINLA